MKWGTNDLTHGHTTLDLSMPYETSSRNGTIYTKEAVRNALANMEPGLPVLTGTESVGDCVRGITTSGAYDIRYDEINKRIAYKVDVRLFVAQVERLEDGNIASIYL